MSTTDLVWTILVAAYATGTVVTVAVLWWEDHHAGPEDSDDPMREQR